MDNSDASNSNNERNYEVGYGRPPKHARFQPGKSGNPQGRPKQVKDIHKIFDQELSRLVSIQENGRVQSIPVRRVLIKKTISDAIKGDPRARQLLFQFMQQHRDVENFEVDGVGKAALTTWFESQIQGKNQENS